MFRKFLILDSCNIIEFTDSVKFLLSIINIKFVDLSFLTSKEPAKEEYSPQFKWKNVLGAFNSFNPIPFTNWSKQKPYLRPLCVQIQRLLFHEDSLYSIETSRVVEYRKTKVSFSITIRIFLPFLKFESICCLDLKETIASSDLNQTHLFLGTSCNSRQLLSHLRRCVS